MILKDAYVSTNHSYVNIISIICSDHSRDGTSSGIRRHLSNDPVLEGGSEDVGEVGVSTTMGRMAGYWPGA